MRAWVAVTDKDWYRFLRQRPDLDEVNFWPPRGRRLFATLTPACPSLHASYPDNAVVGGGILHVPSRVQVSVAWEAFGEKSAASYEGMTARGAPPGLPARSTGRWR